MKIKIIVSVNNIIIQLINSNIYTHDIWDQGFDSICHCVAVIDMVTIMYRLLGRVDLKLSPKILIDARCGTVEDARKIICNPELGLRSICDYQFTFPRTP